MLQVLHLFWPINRPVSTIIMAILAFCAAGVVLVRAFRANWTWPQAGRAAALAVALGVVAFAVFQPVFNSCTKAMCHYDLGLYYLKTIRWTEGFPIVPGLVNVQEHLALNQSAFLVIALVDSLIPNRWGVFLVGGFLPWLGLTLSLFAILRLVVFAIRKQPGATPLETAYAISLPAWLFTLANAHISSASPDCIISCLCIHLFIVFAAFVASTDQQERVAHLSEIMLLGAACIVVKSICAGSDPRRLGSLSRHPRVSTGARAMASSSRRRILAMAAIVAVVLMTWMGRGLFCPATLFSRRAPWRCRFPGGSP